MNNDVNSTVPDNTERRELIASLRETARDVLGRESDSDRVRELIDDPTGHDPALWKTMADLGWLGLAVPESDGGSGAGFAELAVVIEELGRFVTPSPFLGSAVLATSAFLGASDTDLARTWLPRLCDGSAVGTVALSGHDGRVGVDLLEMRLTGGTITGTAGYVVDAAAADVLVVAAAGDSGPVLVAVEADRDGVTVTPKATVDGTRRIATVTLTDVAVGNDDALVSGSGARDAYERLVDLASVAIALDAAGGARHALEQTVAYAGEREQFGRKIGSFQAVKHHCANMLIAVEGASAAAQRAVDAVEGDPASLPEAASSAASHAVESYVFVAGDSVQVHGGVGFTWEFDCHLFLKRAFLSRSMFGDTRFHRERLAALLDPRG